MIEIREDDHYCGRGDAPYVIVQYGDFADARCGELYWELKRLLHASDGRVALVFRHSPQSPAGLAAAEASEAAAAQGAFWDMHDALFESPDDHDAAGLFALADEIELDLVRFTGDLDEHRFAMRVARDMAQCQQPALFLDGERVTIDDLRETLVTDAT